MDNSQKKRRAWGIVGTMILICMAALFFRFMQKETREAPAEEKRESSTIRIGLLFSNSGTSAVVEGSMRNAAQMAIEEINEKGGIHGKMLEGVYRSYASDPALAQEAIRYLMEEEKVAATIGCYTSASRQATLKQLEKNNGLLIYPTYTEGEEQDPRVIYTGSVFHQQADDLILWMMEEYGNKVYLVGSDYIFSVSCNKQAKELIETNGGIVVGERYETPGKINFEKIIDDIKEKKADFIFSDLVGDSAVAFYRAYKEAGIDPSKCPIGSNTMDEMLVQSMGEGYAQGHYSAMSYFSSLDTENSRSFVERYQKKYHDGTQVTALAESAYNSCYLLAEAMKKIDDLEDTEALIEAFSGLKLEAPGGTIFVDEKNHYTWLYSRFARFENGKFKILYESEEAVRPQP